MMSKAVFREVLNVVAIILKEELKAILLKMWKNRRKYSIGTRQWILKLNRLGESRTLPEELLLEDKEGYRNPLRVSEEKIDELLLKIQDRIMTLSHDFITGPTEGMILRGITALELSGLAPVQYCGKILCDLGAKVIRIDKTGHLSPQDTLLGNGKLSVSLDLKSAKGIEVFKKLSSTADVLIEPYRPGIMEKLGIGPDVLMKDNKLLIYVRLSGFGQTGIYSKQAGHDINFISLAGVLALLEKPDKGIHPPCNIIGDFAAGSLLCSFGIVLALFERERSGHGQVVDVSMMRGSSYLVSWILATKKLLWSQPVGCNLLDGGAYMYHVYKTKDGKWMAVGALEPKFYKDVLVGLELTEDECPYFCDNGFEIFTKKFLEKTQSEWTQIFSKLDACVTPVMSADEAVRVRPGDFVKMYGDELPQPLPEPRFSRNTSMPSASLPPPTQGQHTVSTLLSLGYTYQQIQQLASDNVIFFPKESKL